MVTQLVTKVEEAVEEIASSENFSSHDFDSIMFFTNRLVSTHTLGATGSHTPVATTTHTLGDASRSFFFLCSLGGLSNTHTLGATGSHTPVATTTHTLGFAPGQLFFLEVKVEV